MSDRVIIPSGREHVESDVVVGYMCLTDFEHEIGIASGGNTVYPSVEDLMENKPCYKGCGIVEVEVRFRRVVSEGSDPS